MMAGNPNWWSVNGMHTQSHQLPSSSSPPPFLYVSSSSSSSASLDSSTANPSQEFPVRSWSQLLLGGLAGTEEDEKFGTSLFQQQKKMENWGDQVLNPSFRVPVVDVKQEISQTRQLYGHVDDEFQASKSSCWPQVIPDSSSTSSITSVSNNILNFSGAKMDHDRKNQHPDHSSECNSTSIGGVSKKPKVQQSSTQPALKVRKEKLGDRITALHQIVSPFGKTDTASVLSEAIGYIRFLQGQIEALSSPYMRNASRSMGHQQSVQERDCLFPEESGQFLNDVSMEGREASEENTEDGQKDLRSRGLCLVPVSCTQHVGNVMYALAYDLNSISILLIGRLCCGFGSARAVNRRYISDCVPLKIRMQASAGFVSASALGMACGPALAGLLQTNFKIYKITFNQVTLPGWVMALAWLIYLIWLWISFREPARESEVNHVQQESSGVENDKLEKGLAQPLLTSTENEQDDEGDQEFDGSEEAPEESRLPANSLGSAYRLLTPSVKVQLLIYFMLKYAMEILLSESSVITTYYFGWTTSTVSIFLACLGLTVLPVNIVVGSYISNMFEDRQILLASEIVVLLGILFSFHIIIPYSVPQYVVSGLVMFVSAEVLEGVNLSLLSRVMSSRLSRGTYNGGLLSTEAGTLARVIADGTITLAGYLGQENLLNTTLLPSLVICIGSIVATCCTFNDLY